MPLAPGARLGPYEIVAPLGKGGMGEVYRAHDSRLNRDVAVKLSSAHFSERFAGEARAIAALNHPNVCTLFDVGPDYLVMELVEGQTLAERIKEGPLPAGEALRIARQIAAALEAAHEKNIVHRDLKPANVKIKPDGLVKVLDFGLAKAMEPQDSAAANLTSSATLTLEATRAGMILGTAGYMSPEQARGKPVDKRADIWAFGVVLYEMLTGRMTFEGETVSDTLAAVLRADIDWSRLPAGTPPKLRRLLQRCLERDPARRLRDIGDAWIEIDAPDEPVALPPPSRKAGAWLPWAAAAVIAAAGVAWGLFHKAPEAQRPVVRWSYTQSLPFDLFALSPDGTHLVFTELIGSNVHILLRATDQLEAKPIPGSDGGGAGAFSPDGQWLAFASDILTAPKLKRIPLTGGTPITVCECSPSGNGFSWGDDGNILFSGGKGIMRVSATGGTPQAVTSVDPNKGESSHVYPSYLPGARSFLFTIGTGTGYRVGVFDFKKGQYKVVVSSGANASYLPTGHLVYVRGNTLFAAPFDVGRLEVTGPETPVIDGIGGVFTNAVGGYSVSRNGRLVYGAGSSQGGKTTLTWVDRKGAEQSLGDPQSWGTGRLSPDGTRIANSIRSDSGEGDIWIYEIGRKTLNRITFHENFDNPAWTPDGKRVAFGGTFSGKKGLYWAPTDGSGKAELLAATDSQPSPSSWSPDGQTLVFAQPGPDKGAHLWTISLADRKPVLLHDTAFAESDGQVSPDGRWIAYVSPESGANEIYLQPFPKPGPKVRISTQGGMAPRWSHNGRQLLYWGGLRTALMTVDVETGAAVKVGLPQPLFEKATGTTWDVSPDGNHFLVEVIGAGRNFRMDVVVNWFNELRRRVPTRGN